MSDKTLPEPKKRLSQICQTPSAIYLQTQGKLGEKLFAGWLNRKGYPYIYISQDQRDFSDFLKNIGAKRPDFLIFLPELGIIAVDVKNYTPSQFKAEYTEKTISKKTVTISKNETDPAKRFFDLTRLPLWYAFVGADGEVCDEWYFTHINEVPSKGVLRSGRNGYFYVLDLSELCHINNNLDSLVEYALTSTRQRYSSQHNMDASINQCNTKKSSSSISARKSRN